VLRGDEAIGICAWRYRKMDTIQQINLITSQLRDISQEVGIQNEAKLIKTAQKTGKAA
jgi:hypothetical protein